MLTKEGREYEFNLDWIAKHNWKVVPVESMARIPVPDIPRLVSVLKRAGYISCLVIFNERGYVQNLPLAVASAPRSDLATCHMLSVDEADFLEFNRELGCFRSVLMPDDRSWAISCNEHYNLFGAKPNLLEALLGKSIAQAQQAFLEFALLLSRGRSDDPLLQLAKYYSAL